MGMLLLVQLAWSPSDWLLGVRVDSLLTVGVVSASATVRCRCRVGGPPSRSPEPEGAAVCACSLHGEVGMLTTRGDQAVRQDCSLLHDCWEPSTAYESEG
jgi:hypothetical protein